MAYLCVDKRGEFIADECPERCFGEWMGWRDVYVEESCTLIPPTKRNYRETHWQGNDLGR